MTTILECFGIAWNSINHKIRNQMLEGSDLDDINRKKLWEDFGKRQQLRIFYWCQLGLTEIERKKMEQEICSVTKYKRKVRE